MACIKNHNRVFLSHFLSQVSEFAYYVLPCCLFVIEFYQMVFIEVITVEKNISYGLGIVHSSLEAGPMNVGVNSDYEEPLGACNSSARR